MLAAAPWPGRRCASGFKVFTMETTSSRDLEGRRKKQWWKHVVCTWILSSFHLDTSWLVVRVDKSLCSCHFRLCKSRFLQECLDVKQNSRRDCPYRTKVAETRPSRSYELGSSLALLRVQVSSYRQNSTLNFFNNTCLLFAESCLLRGLPLIFFLPVFFFKESFRLWIWWSCGVVYTSVCGCQTSPWCKKIVRRIFRLFYTASRQTSFRCDSSRAGGTPFVRCGTLSIVCAWTNTWCLFDDSSATAFSMCNRAIGRKVF